MRDAWSYPLPRLVGRAVVVLGAGAGLWMAGQAVASATETAMPPPLAAVTEVVSTPTDPVAPVLPSAGALVAGPADDGGGAPVGPVAVPVVGVAAPLVSAVTSATAPAVQALTPVVHIAAPVVHVVAPVVRAVPPVVAPVLPVVAPVLTPASTAVAPVTDIVDTVPQVAGPVAAPAPGTGADVSSPAVPDGTWSSPASRSRTAPALPATPPAAIGPAGLGTPIAPWPAPLHPVPSGCSVASTGATAAPRGHDLSAAPSTAVPAAVPSRPTAVADTARDAVGTTTFDPGFCPD